MGQRLLVGGSSCGPAPSILRAYRLTGGPAHLEPAAPLRLPGLEKRRVHVIAPAGRAVLAGMDGALLKSDDGGRSFRYVLLHAAGAHSYPAITRLLALRNRTQVVIAAGADAGTGKPYLAVSGDGGERWTELSSILPGHEGASPAAAAAITSLVQDRAGRVLLTLNLAPHSQGRLLMLTLGGLD